MPQKCLIPNAIEKIRAGAFVPFGFVGASLTLGSGASNTAVTSWRRLFMRYVYEHLVYTYNCKVGEINAAIGAMRSAGSVFMLERNVLPGNPRLTFVEECYNDMRSPDKQAVGKAVEGIIRQLKAARSDVVFLGAGCRDGCGNDEQTHLVDHSIHRRLCDHYGLAFIDIQDHIHGTLKQREQSWSDVAVTYSRENDGCHLNDYGQRLWFECMRDWLERQFVLYDVDPTQRTPWELPEPLYSDELQFTRLVNPTRPNKHIALQGGWEKGDAIPTPWYMDNVLVGRPGDKLTFSFTGTAIGTLSFGHNNGLKVNARIDGEDAVGPYSNFAVEYGAFDLIRHGLDKGEHLLELEVGQPMKRKNFLDDPRAMIAYLAVGGIE